MRKAFTLVELLVVISIIAMLLAVLMPSLQKARKQAKTVVCASTVKQVGLSLGIYTTSNNDRLPTENWVDASGVGHVWTELLIAANPSLQNIRCSEFPFKDRGFGSKKHYVCSGGYGLNSALDPINQWESRGPSNPRKPLFASSYKRQAETPYMLESTANIPYGQSYPNWDYPYVDYLSVMPTNYYKKVGGLWAHTGTSKNISPQIRANHGAKPLVNNVMLGNFVFRSLKEMDEVAKINVLFLDQHAATIKFGALRNEEGISWGYVRRGF